ncbi:MAG: hypothetical protein ACO1RA_14000 [Planctomycetaceae bacterium]
MMFAFLNQNFALILAQGMFTTERAVVAGIVVAAVIYVAWQIWQTLFVSPKSACGGGGCHGCSGSTPSSGIKIVPLVQIGTKPESTDKP